MTVLKDACQYPEETVDVFVFDTHHPLLRVFFSDAVFNSLVGFRLMKYLRSNVVANLQ